MIGVGKFMGSGKKYFQISLSNNFAMVKLGLEKKGNTLLILKKQIRKMGLSNVGAVIETEQNRLQGGF